MSKMKIKYVGSDVRRFGTGIFTVEDHKGAELVRAGRAIALVDDETCPKIDVIVKKANEEQKQSSKKHLDVGGKRVHGFPKVGWIHDTEKFGGAELSNKTVMATGKQLGFDIYECFPSTFNKQELIRCDFLIINNFFFFEQEQYHFIMDLLFEYKRPFVKYEHDHREIIGDRARPKIARLLFGRSFLNVFISPFQMENHRKSLGDLIEPYFILPPAVDTSVFKLLPEVKRDRTKVVNVCGKLYHSKGFTHMLLFVKNKPEYTFEIYTQNNQEVKSTFEQLPNVKVFSVLPNHALAQVYNSAGYTIHLPQAYEACGRSIAEGLLCGCQPILNKNVGITSFSWYNQCVERKLQTHKIQEICKQGVFDFWKSIETAYYNRVEVKNVEQRVN